MGQACTVSVFSLTGRELVTVDEVKGLAEKDLRRMAAKELNVHEDWVRLVCGSGQVLERNEPLPVDLFRRDPRVTAVASCRPSWSVPGGQTITVKGAGSRIVNGIYFPVETMPLRDEGEVRSMKWRHSSIDWLHIHYQEEAWWIGHYAECAHDLYCSELGSASSPPCSDGDQGWMTLSGSACEQGIDPPPQLSWEGEENPAPPFAEQSEHAEAQKALIQSLAEIFFMAVHATLEFPQWPSNHGVDTPRPHKQKDQVERFYSTVFSKRGKPMTLRDLQKGLRSLGVPDEIAKMIFKVADCNSDGRVDHKEFENWLFGGAELVRAHGR